MEINIYWRFLGIVNTLLNRIYWVSLTILKDVNFEIFVVSLLVFGINLRFFLLIYWLFDVFDIFTIRLSLCVIFLFAYTVLFYIIKNITLVTQILIKRSLISFILISHKDRNWVFSPNCVILAFNCVIFLKFDCFLAYNMLQTVYRNIYVLLVLFLNFDLHNFYNYYPIYDSNCLYKKS